MDVFIEVIVCWFVIGKICKTMLVHGTDVGKAILNLGVILLCRVLIPVDFIHLHSRLLHRHLNIQVTSAKLSNEL